MHVAAADAACRHADQYFIRAGLWLGHVGEFELQILFQDEGFHRRLRRTKVRSRKFRLYNCAGSKLEAADDTWW
jgi:hypothetical protein